MSTYFKPAFHASLDWYAAHMKGDYEALRRRKAVRLHLLGTSLSDGGEPA